MIFDVDRWLPRLHANMQQNWGGSGPTALGRQKPEKGA